MCLRARHHAVLLLGLARPRGVPMSRADDRRMELFERVVAEELAAVFGEDFVAARARHQDGSRPGPGVEAPDLWIECERADRTEPLAVLFDAEAEANGSGLWPVAICMDKGHP